MASIMVDGSDLIIGDLNSSKSTKRQIPIRDIDSMKIIERSSFYHPIIGFIFGIVCLSFAIYTLVIHMLSHSSFVLLLVPRGGLIWVPLAVGIYIFVYLWKSKRIPWIIIHRTQGKMVIPLDKMSLSEAKSFIENISKR